MKWLKNLFRKNTYGTWNKYPDTLPPMRTENVLMYHKRRWMFLDCIGHPDEWPEVTHWMELPAPPKEDK